MSTIVFLALLASSSNVNACQVQPCPQPVVHCPSLPPPKTQEQYCSNECLSCPSGDSSTRCPVLTCPPPSATPPPSNEFNCQFVVAHRTSISRNGIDKPVTDPYFAACKSGDLNKVKATLAAHPTLINDGNADHVGVTCLHYAIAHNKRNVFDYLVAHPNIDIHAKNAHDDANIMIAGGAGNTFMIAKLLEMGDKIDMMRFIQVNRDGTCKTTGGSFNALDYAIYSSKQAAADLLIREGAKCFCYLTATCNWHYSSHGLGYQYCPEGIASPPQ